jgi:transposase
MPGRRLVSDAVNKLNMTERETILSLLRLGWSERRVAREGNHHRSTVRRVGREAGVGPSKCSSAAKVPTDPKPPIAAAAPRALAALPTRSSAAPFGAFIESELAKGRNGAAIYQDLVEHHGYDGSYDAVKRLARKLRGGGTPKVSCRFETDPGQEGQVDYGEGALTRDPRTGKYRKPRLFVMTLGKSRHAFRKTIWKSSTQAWSTLHEEAFAYFGGAPRTIRLDNLKEGVIKPDIYDPQLNALYAKMLEHYGVVALPCRPYAPDLKGKVESAVGYTQTTALKGRRFESIEEQNVFLTHWNERWAATRIHGTTKQQVRVMFDQERPFLLPLPTTRFEYYRIGERTVHLDGHIEVNSAYYSAPPRYVGRKVIVHIGRLWLRILDFNTHEFLREFPMATQKGQRRTHDADRPKQTPPQIENLVIRIAGAGEGCGTFARRLVEERGAVALRALFGILDLLKRYELAAVNRACLFATTSGVTSLRFVRTYLTHHATRTKLKDEHHIIPQIETYTTHFNTFTRGETL